MPKPGQSVEIGAEVRAGALSRAERLARLPLWKQLALLAFWPLLEQILAFAVGTTDTVIAGRFADPGYRQAALDALGLGTYVMWLQSIVQGAVATGGTALVSRAAGSGQRELARRATQQTLILGALAGLAIGIAMWFGVPGLVALFGIDDPVTRQLAVEYLRWQAFVAPFSGILFAINACRRGSGDTRTPFWTMLLVNGVNIALSWALTFGPLGGHGVTGLAIGTCCGWAAGAVAAVAWLCLPGQELRPRLKLWRIDPELGGRIARVGLPSAMEVSSMWFFNAVLLWMMGQVPASKGLLGVHNLVLRCDSMAFLPGFAVAMAAGALCGQHLGREDRDGAQRVLLLAWKVALIFMCSLGLVFLLVPRPLLALMVPDDDHLLSLAVPVLVICGLQQPWTATCVLLKSVFRAIGDAKTVMKYAYGSQALLRVGGAWWLGIHLGWGLRGIWMAMLADTFAQALIFGWRALSRRWMEVKV